MPRRTLVASQRRRGQGADDGEEAAEAEEEDVEEEEEEGEKVWKTLEVKNKKRVKSSEEELARMRLLQEWQ